MKHYAIVHKHRYGTSDYLVRCAHFPTEQEIIKYCEIDFEPDRGEGISISGLSNYYEITEIPSTDDNGH